MADEVIKGGIGIVGIITITLLLSTVQINCSAGWENILDDVYLCKGTHDMYKCDSVIKNNCIISKGRYNPDKIWISNNDMNCFTNSTNKEFYCEFKFDVEQAMINKTVKYLPKGTLQVYDKVLISSKIQAIESMKYANFTIKPVLDEPIKEEVLD